MNSIVIDGRVVRDPEYKEVGANGTPLLDFTIANNTGYGDYEATHFFKCKLWGKRASGLANHIVKGKPLIVRGEMKMNSWEGDDGKKRYSWELNIQELSFHMKDGTTPSNGATPKAEGGFPAPPTGGIAKPPADVPNMNTFDDDIPFN